MELTIVLAALKGCRLWPCQPEMKGQLMGYFFIGAAMSEALALLGLVLFFIG